MQGGLWALLYVLLSVRVIFFFYGLMMLLWVEHCYI